MSLVNRSLLRTLTLSPSACLECPLDDCRSKDVQLSPPRSPVLTCQIHTPSVRHAETCPTASVVVSCCILPEHVTAGQCTLRHCLGLCCTREHNKAGVLAHERHHLSLLCCTQVHGLGVGDAVGICTNEEGDLVVEANTPRVRQATVRPTYGATAVHHMPTPPPGKAESFSTGERFLGLDPCYSPTLASHSQNALQLHPSFRYRPCSRCFISSLYPSSWSHPHLEATPSLMRFFIWICGLCSLCRWWLQLGLVSVWHRHAFC